MSSASSAISRPLSRRMRRPSRSRSETSRSSGTNSSPGGSSRASSPSSRSSGGSVSTRRSGASLFSRLSRLTGRTMGSFAADKTRNDQFKTLAELMKEEKMTLGDAVRMRDVYEAKGRWTFERSKRSRRIERLAVAASEKALEKKVAPKKVKKLLTSSEVCTWKLVDDRANVFQCTNFCARDPRTNEVSRFCGYHSPHCLDLHPGFAPPLTEPNEHGLCATHFVARFGRAPPKIADKLEIPGVVLVRTATRKHLLRPTAKDVQPFLRFGEEARRKAEREDRAAHAATAASGGGRKRTGAGKREKDEALPGLEDADAEDDEDRGRPEIEEDIFDRMGRLAHRFVVQLGIFKSKTSHSIVRFQARWRGLLARRTVARMRREKAVDDRFRAASYLQRLFRRKRAEAELEMMKKVMHLSADRIQRSYRFAVWRRRVAADRRRALAAMTIQRNWRLYRLRQNYHMMRLRLRSRVTGIKQARARVMMTRLMLGWIARYRVQRERVRQFVRSQMVVRIQRAVRNWLAWRHREEAMERARAERFLWEQANRIQSAWRNVRRWKLWKRDRVSMIAAANTIQRYARGFLARLEAKRRRRRMDEMWLWLRPSMPRQFYRSMPGFPNYETMFDLSRFRRDPGAYLAAHSGTDESVAPSEEARVEEAKWQQVVQSVDRALRAEDRMGVGQLTPQAFFRVLGRFGIPEPILRVVALRYRDIRKDEVNIDEFLRLLHDGDMHPKIERILRDMAVTTILKSSDKDPGSEDQSEDSDLDEDARARARRRRKGSMSHWGRRSSAANALESGATIPETVALVTLPGGGEATLMPFEGTLESVFQDTKSVRALQIQQRVLASALALLQRDTSELRRQAIRTAEVEDPSKSEPFTASAVSAPSPARASSSPLRSPSRTLSPLRSCRRESSRAERRSPEPPTLPRVPRAAWPSGLDPRPYDRLRAAASALPRVGVGSPDQARRAPWVDRIAEAQFDGETRRAAAESKELAAMFVDEGGVIRARERASVFHEVMDVLSGRGLRSRVLFEGSAASDSALVKFLFDHHTFFERSWTQVVRDLRHGTVYGHPPMPERADLLEDACRALGYHSRSSLRRTAVARGLDASAGAATEGVIAKPPVGPRIARPSSPNGGESRLPIVRAPVDPLRTAVPEDPTLSAVPPLPFAPVFPELPRVDIVGAMLTVPDPLFIAAAAEEAAALLPRPASPRTLILPGPVHDGSDSARRRRGALAIVRKARKEVGLPEDLDDFGTLEAGPSPVRPGTLAATPGGVLERTSVSWFGTAKRTPPYVPPPPIQLPSCPHHQWLFPSPACGTCREYRALPLPQPPCTFHSGAFVRRFRRSRFEATGADDLELNISLRAKSLPDEHASAGDASEATGSRVRERRGPKPRASAPAEVSITKGDSLSTVIVGTARGGFFPLVVYGLCEDSRGSSWILGFRVWRPAELATVQAKWEHALLRRGQAVLGRRLLFVRIDDSNIAGQALVLVTSDPVEFRRAVARSGLPEDNCFYVVERLSEAVEERALRMAT